MCHLDTWSQTASAAGSGVSCVPGPLSTSSQGDNTDDSHRFSPGAGVTRAPACPQSWVKIGVRGPGQAGECGRPILGRGAHVPLSYALHPRRTLRAGHTRTLIMYSMRLWECFSITDSIQIKGLTCRGEGRQRARLVVLQSSFHRGETEQVTTGPGVSPMPGTRGSWENPSRCQDGSEQRQNAESIPEDTLGMLPGKRGSGAKGPTPFRVWSLVLTSRPLGAWAAPGAQALATVHSRGC